MSIRTVIADDHNVVRAGFKMLLENDPQIEVVGEASDGAQAYAVVAREKPDLLLIDISMPPGKNGLIACQDISRDFPKTKIIVVTMFAEVEYLRYSLEGGAKGYLLKSSEASELIEAVHAVMGGEVYIDSRMRELMPQAEDKDASKDSPMILTPRELEVLTLLAKGYTNKQVAEELFVSIKTVEMHRSRIYSKLGFEDRSSLVSYALAHKLLQV